MIARTAVAQDDTSGDGTTSTVIFIGELMKQSERYIDEGMHPHVLVDGFEIAKRPTLQFLEKFKTSVVMGDEPDKEILKMVARTTLRTKLYEALADQLTDIVVNAVLCIRKPEEPIDVEILRMHHKFDVDTRLEMQWMLPSGCPSVLLLPMDEFNPVEGLVLDHGSRHPDMKHRAENCHILTCNVSLEYEKSDQRYRLLLKSMGSMEEKRENQLMILYASQTGNAMDVAERLGREAERRGCPSVLLPMDEFNPSDLPNKEAVIFVASTTGQGDNPDSMKGFWRFLLQKNLTKDWLERVNYAVFGLGDSSYQKYNFVAKKLDKRLSSLGAKAILERGLGDDQHPSGYEGALDPWMSSLWTMLYQMNQRLLPNAATPDTTLIDQPKIQVMYHDIKEFSPITTNTDITYLEMLVAKVHSMNRAKFSGKNRPDCFLNMTKNDRLTRVDSGKDVRHLEFEAVSCSIDYDVGDILEVLPSQSPEALDAFMQRCNLNPESYITVQARFNENHGFLKPSSPVKLKSFVELTMDVASASPKRYFFEVMSFFATAEHEKERLQHFASPEGRDDLYQYNQKERRTVLEVLEDFPSVQMPFEWLVQLVPPLKTRAFSISSSHSAHPNQVHLTVSVVSWTTPYKRKRLGLCSSWLAGLDSDQRVLIPAWIIKGSLPPPPPCLPLILVGPGTGCAPFQGFVEERAIQSKTVPTAPVIFFFGCRNEKDDFLYRDFWLLHSQKNGVLSEDKGGGFYVAFSREQPHKVYVQHKMKEQHRKIWSLLSQGAAVYVVGSANKMPSDVLSAFEEIISTETGVPREVASRWIQTLERAGKYHVEAWS